MRYSVRYVPGTARLADGFTTEWSSLSNPNNKGRTLDEAMEDSSQNELWYPKVWPRIEETIGSKTIKIPESKLAEVKAKETDELI